MKSIKQKMKKDRIHTPHARIAVCLWSNRASGVVTCEGLSVERDAPHV